MHNLHEKLVSDGSTCNHVLTETINQAWAGEIWSKHQGCPSKRKTLPWNWQELNYFSCSVPSTQVSTPTEVAFLGANLKAIFSFCPIKQTLLFCTEMC